MGLRAVTVFIGVLGLAASADAAGQMEAPPPESPPQTSWAGFYVGINGGYGSSARPPAMQADWPPIATGRLAASSLGGGVGGVQAAYNWQGLLDKGVVLGIQGDLTYEKLEGTLTTAGALEARTSLNSFGTLKGRTGYAWDRVLLYATAGLAFGDIENTLFYKDGFGQAFSVDAETTRIGYSAGGGIGLSLTPTWSLKVEYEFLHLGGLSTSESVGDGPGSTVRITDFGHDYQIIRAGLDYHVGGGSQSLK